MRHCFRSLLFLAAIFNLRADWSVVRWTSLGVLEGGATAWEAEASTEARSVRLQGISFASGRCALRVIDSPPNNRRPLQAALAATRAVGGSNGGYFHEDFTPLGLVVREGERLHSFERVETLERRSDRAQEPHGTPSLAKIPGESRHSGGAPGRPLARREGSRGGRPQ